MGSKSSKAKRKPPAPTSVPASKQKEDSEDSASSSSSSVNSVVIHQSVESAVGTGSVTSKKPSTAAAATNAAYKQPSYVPPTPPPYEFRGKLMTDFTGNGEFVIDSRRYGSPYWMSPERITQDKDLHVLAAVPNVLGRLAQLRADATVNIIDENPIGRGGYRPTREGIIDNNGPMALHRIGTIDEKDQDELLEITLIMAMLALDIQHPNLNPVSQLCVVQNQDFYLVSPLCLSARLENFIQDVSLREPHIAYIMKGALLGLQYLHSRGLAHTEVRSSRIYFARNTLDVRLLMKTASLACNWLDKSDIWALGIVLFEILENEVPYADLHPMRAWFLIPKSDPPVPRQPFKWSSDLLSFLASCLQKDPSLRPTTTALLEHPFITQACSREEFCKAYKHYFEQPTHFGNHLSLEGPEKLP